MKTIANGIFFLGVAALVLLLLPALLWVAIPGLGWCITEPGLVAYAGLAAVTILAGLLGL